MQYSPTVVLHRPGVRLHRTLWIGVTAAGGEQAAQRPFADRWNPLADSFQVHDVRFGPQRPLDFDVLLHLRHLVLEQRDAHQAGLPLRWVSQEVVKLRPQLDLGLGESVGPFLAPVAHLAAVAARSLVADHTLIHDNNVHACP